MTTANWVGCPSTPEGHEAYRKGLCKKCLVKPYQAGSTMCAECWPMPTYANVDYGASTMWGDVTDEQRTKARAASNTRQTAHDLGGDNDYQIATKKAGNQGHYEFLMGALGFHNCFGGPEPDLKLRRGGTRDSGLRINQSGKTFVVIPKVNAYKGPDQRLRIPVGTESDNAIYVAARYHELRDDVELVGWEYSRDVVALNDLRMFVNKANYTVPYMLLRSMNTLGRRA
jgi:hypothetical protein